MDEETRKELLTQFDLDPELLKEVPRSTYAIDIKKAAYERRVEQLLMEVKLRDAAKTDSQNERAIARKLEDAILAKMVGVDVDPGRDFSLAKLKEAIRKVTAQGPMKFESELMKNEPTSWSEEATYRYRGAEIRAEMFADYMSAPPRTRDVELGLYMPPPANGQAPTEKIGSVWMSARTAQQVDEGMSNFKIASRPKMRAMERPVDAGEAIAESTYRAIDVRVLYGRNYPRRVSSWWLVVENYEHQWTLMTSEEKWVC